ncbi:MAG TPA: stability/partitioning determinant, partial [Alphaproteobacteria bacterium]|nr:stability/partitioning determinant [Alphaproteobacteria bacterium]
MAERAGIFENGGDDFDVSAFAPKKPVKQEQPGPDAVRAVSEGANFRSREPAAQAKPPKKADRRYRTGRNRQLNTKVTAETEKLLYEIYDAHRETQNWP